MSWHFWSGAIRILLWHGRAETLLSIAAHCLPSRIAIVRSNPKPPDAGAGVLHATAL
jgi:hypothetical protein